MSTRSDICRRSYRAALVVAALAVAAITPARAGATPASDPVPDGSSALAAISVGVVGTVTDGATGVAAIDVRVYDAATRVAVAKTRTHADGTYEVAVPPGSYRVRFSDAHGSWRTQWFSAASTFDTATVVTVALGTTTADAELVRPSTLLVGQAETASDHIIPLPGIAVRVYDATTNLVVAKTVSGVDGWYHVADLPPGAYLVRFSDPGGTYGLTWYPTAGNVLGAAPVVVTEGSLARADGLIWPTGQVIGTVNSVEGFLAGIQVRLYDGSNGALVAKSVTEADGSYAFTGLHMGSYGRGAYRVRFRDPTGTYALQWYPGAPTAATASIVDVDVRTTGPGYADAFLIPNGTLTGHVSDATGPLAGISVRIYSAAAVRTTEVTSGADGSWSAVVGEGSYKIGFGDDSGAHQSVWYPSAPSFRTAPLVYVAPYVATDVGDQVLALAPTPPAALDLVVDSATDARDAAPGDGLCDDGTGHCPLRAAIDETTVSPSADTITIAPGVDPTLTLVGAGEDANATGDLDSVGALTIHGNDATLDAGGLDRGLQHLGELHIDHLTITGGTTQDDHRAPRGDDGGAVLAFGSVELTDSTLTGNAAVRTGSGRGGGLAVIGNLTMTRGTVSDNVAENLGGGIWAQGASVVITDSTIDGNRTSVLERDVDQNGSAAAVDIGSREAHAGVATISGTTISNNVSTLCCGSQSGGGLILAVATATVVNSTIVSNQANMVPGGYVTIGGGAGVSGDGAHVALVHDTIADNTGYEGVYQILPGGGVGPFTVRGSIVVGPTPVCNGAWISLGWNLISDPSCEVPYADATDRVITDALLGLLGDNGGLTPTRLPLIGSAAVDAVPVGTPGLCDGTIAWDQRGIARPQGTGCDIGAVERSP